MGTIRAIGLSRSQTMISSPDRTYRKCALRFAFRFATFTVFIATIFYNVTMMVML